MGLAPYGEPRFVDAILEHLIDLHDDGSFTVNRKYFGYLASLRMTNGRFDELFGGPPRAPESDLTRREMDLARSIQEVTEEIVLRMARTAASLTGERRRCWPAAWPSTAWPTAGCSAKGPSTTSGSSPPRATPAAPSGPRSRAGTRCWATSGPSPGPTP